MTEVASTPRASPSVDAGVATPPVESPIEPSQNQRGQDQGGQDQRSSEASPEFMRLITHDFARRHLILSAGRDGDAEMLLIAHSTKQLVIHNVGVRLGVKLRMRVVPEDSLAAAIDAAYVAVHHARQPDSEALARDEIVVTSVRGSDHLEEDLAAAVLEAERDLLRTQGKAPAVKLVDLVLFEAIRRGASDVHVQPTRDRTLVRYRLDGVLHTVRSLPASLANAVVARLKVMSNLDIAERRAPQDGRAAVTLGGGGGPRSGPGASGRSEARRVDLRISTIPSTYGERVVARVLDSASSPYLRSFHALGMDEQTQRKYLAQVARTSGIVLSTGPTGSGKTTTLYTTLAWVTASNAGALARGCELNIMTIEDPVEYDLARAALSISQTQVDPKKNVTFATGLRHILRQDPDVVMVGEIRDQETAQMAVQASLTGHLVLSTLHTIDAPSAVARLLDLGIEPFLVASSISGVLAQRLVRTLHAACRAEGCADCLTTGLKGRTGVFELLVMNESLRELVCKRVATSEIRRAARAAGMVSLREAGASLVARGVTTQRELMLSIDTFGDELA
ncbi:MAG: GspE/PulE family protein [Planctomycetota bacterium]|nr:GspE/PulE family protein [Planctomycetota bacterium]